MSEPTTADVEKRPVTHPSSSDPSVNHDDAQFDTPDAHIGVKKVEAAAKVYRGRTKWFLYLGYVNPRTFVLAFAQTDFTALERRIALASYIYSLDGTTTWTYLSWAQSSFGKHSLIASIQVAQSIIIAVGKPIVAKLADVTSRPVAYTSVLLFYVIGYIVIASANDTNQIAGGIVVYAMGYTGLQVLTSIIVADITSLQYRGLVQGLTSAPFILNAFVSAFISESVLGPTFSGWRWGYGMFAILIPAALSPLILTLFWAEHAAYKRGYLEREKSVPLGEKIKRAIIDIDVLGLLLLSAGVALLLLPLTLANNAKGKWHNQSMIAMIVLGPIFLIAFGIYEWRFSPKPLAPGRFLKNPSVVIASLIGFFDFVSFYLTYTYLYSFVYITQPSWSVRELTYFANTQSVALTVFAIMAGVIMRFTHRFKWLLVFGLTVRLAGVGMMIHSRGARGGAAELVINQVIQGFGGGIASLTTTVGSQASVPHRDVAIVTALVLLVTEIGGVVGNAIAGAIWSNTMPGQLRKHLPGLSDEEVTTLFGSIIAVGTYPEGSPERNGAIAAYDEVMKRMLIAAVVIAVIPLILSFFMPNWYLGDTQNAVTEKNIAGEKEEAVNEKEGRHEASA
ncbi:hypothetical protein FRC00_014382 [Tulasnella sp. 408]|nr:hypothetical protein FRC00_014382 [Tulasnella sp. 408]